MQKNGSQQSDYHRIRMESYEVYKRDFGFDIPTKSQQNIDSLKQLLEARNDDKECLTPTELSFKKFWDEHIAPEFIAIHRTKHLSLIENDGYLRSVSSRLEHLSANIHANASGRESLNRQAYFTMGLPGHIEQQHLYDSSCDKIILTLGKAAKCETNPLPGFWVNNHIFEYGRHTTTKGIRFGEYSRYIQYQKEGRLKSYIYQHGDDTYHIRSVNYGDEILSAEQGIHNITDGLFYLFILDICYLGPHAQSLLVKPQKQQIIRVFNSLYPSTVTLEGKYIYQLDLENPFVKCKYSTIEEHLALADFHYAVSHLDIPSIEKHLESNPEFVNIKSADDKTALFSIMSKWFPSNKDIQVIELLLAAGADINQDNGFSDAFTIALNGHSDFALKLLNGVNDTLVPMMKHFLVVAENRNRCQRYLHEAFSVKSDPVIEWLMTKISNFHPSDHIVHSAIKHRKLKWIPELLKRGANINAFYLRRTALINCAEEGKIEEVRFLVENGAGINLGVEVASRNIKNTSVEICADAGCTALHLAAAAGHHEMVSVLLELGADANINNYYGFNALQYAERSKKLITDKVKYTYANMRRFLLEEKQYQEIESKAIQSRLKNVDRSIELLRSKTRNRNVDVSTKVIENEVIKNTVALMTVMTHENRNYVLLVRKKNRQQQPIGHYMFPGGFLDGLDDVPESASIREQEEETCVQIFQRPTIIKSFVKGHHTHTFCILNIEGNPKQFPPAPASDVGQACWIPIDELDIQYHDGFQVVMHGGCRIRHSNAMCLQIMGHLPIEEQRDHYYQWEFEEYGSQKLVKAYSEDDPISFQQEINRGFDISRLDFVSDAVKRDHQDRLELLIQQGANINQMLKVGIVCEISPTSLAIMAGHIELAKYMIEKLNADINVCGSTSVLSEALRENNDELVEWLLICAPSMSEQVLGTALLMCIAMNNTERLKQFIAMNINLNKCYPILLNPNSLCHTALPLHLATNLYRFEHMRLLIQSGAKVSLMQFSRLGPIWYYKHELERTKLHESVHEHDRYSSFNQKTQAEFKFKDEVNSAERLEQVLDILEPAAIEEGHRYCKPSDVSGQSLQTRF